MRVAAGGPFKVNRGSRCKDQPIFPIGCCFMGVASFQLGGPLRAYAPLQVVMAFECVNHRGAVRQFAVDGGEITIGKTTRQDHVNVQAIVQEAVLLEVPNCQFLLIFKKKKYK